MCYSALVQRELDYLSGKYGAVVVREQVENYHRACALDPKAFPPLHSRIFPGHYAPVVFTRNGRREIELMRYGAYPRSQIKNAKNYTSFNARRDNLQSPFWSEAFMQHHGFIVLKGFFEWVKVTDLLAAGVVKLAQIEQEFRRQTAARKAKILAAGKRYKPTPTELKDVHLRQTIIQFQPADEQELLVPVIFSYGDAPDGRRDAGFAIVTDDPPAEIQAAGHDRCPVVLEESALKNWLNPAASTPSELSLLLGQKRRISFSHQLAAAA